MNAARACAVAACLAGCAGARGAIEPGRAVGEVTIGMRWPEVRAHVGELPDALVNNRFVIATVQTRGLELVLTTPDDRGLVDDAQVVAVGARGSGWSGTPRPGQPRREIEAALGAAPDHVGPVDYWPAGVSVEWTGDAASRVGVFAPYARAPAPPEMTPAPEGAS